MVEVSDIIGGVFNFGPWVFWGLIFVGLIIIIILFTLAWFFIYKRRWNLLVEFKMIRSDGEFVLAEQGVGRYDLKNGVIWVKRKRKPREGIKAPDLKKYLQGVRIITIVGNPGNWRIVVPESFLEVTDEESGEKASVMELKGPTKQDKGWETNFDRAWSEAFTIASWLSGPVGQLIGWGILIFIVVIAQFMGFSIILKEIRAG